MKRAMTSAGARHVPSMSGSSEVAEVVTATTVAMVAATVSGLLAADEIVVPTST